MVDHTSHIILGLETSCDETAAAVVEDGVRVRSSVVWSQQELHRRYQGVVPEIASRAHVEAITPVISEAMERAGVSFDELDAIAVGNRPGLIGSLIVGVSAAKALAWSLGKPVIGVDHVRAHLYAARLIYDEAVGDRVEGATTCAERSEVKSCGTPGRPAPPGYPDTARLALRDKSWHPSIHMKRDARPTEDGSYLGLVVSGGHTSLYEVASPLEITLLGRTIDDAVGEAFDKAAVILGLGYPGGPAIDKLAQQGDAQAYDLPRSTLEPGSLDFSFSGLKTALLYTVRGRPSGRGREATFTRSAKDLSDRQRADLAASFQAAAIDAVMMKIRRAVQQLHDAGRPPRGIIIGGGVSANSLLRKRVRTFGQERGLPTYLPAMELCVDNAAMIAGLAYHQARAGRFDDLDLPALATAS